jgi:hypothetical protein
MPHDLPYDEACNLEPHRDDLKPLTKAESEELRALNGRTLTLPEFKRRSELRDRCLLYGQEGVEAQAFVGLEPRYIDESGNITKEVMNSVVEWCRANEASFYHVTYGEELVMPDWDATGPRPKPSRWQRLKWRLEYRAQAVLDFVEDTRWIVSQHKRFFVGAALLWVGGFLMGFGLRGLIGG